VYASEDERGEHREDAACEKRWTSVDKRKRQRGQKLNSEFFKPGHRGDEIGHLLRRGVASVRDPLGAKTDKAGGGRKQLGQCREI